ncbi:MAG: ethanolamine ammonia-lyase subunit EutC [Pseudomonadota bacterium]
MGSRFSDNDPWQNFKRLTPARIALGRAGGSLPTQAWLEFKYAHALARDAVHRTFDAEPVQAAITALGASILVVDSRAEDRSTYLTRPDLGRRLSDASRHLLESRAKDADLVIIVSDGLSSEAVHRQTVPLMKELLPRLQDGGWRMAPVVIARFGRVALEDEIGALLKARIALMLLGERPGLGSPDSLGAYLVHTPKPGNTDADRNCVSNIRPEGLSHESAAETLFYLLAEARRRGHSGVALKDERPALANQSASGILDRREKADSQ